jgi:hypothetical protein
MATHYRTPMILTGTLSASANAMHYFPVGQGYYGVTEISVEDRCKVPFRQSGTIKNLRLNVSSNASATSTVITVRKNGADTALTITVPATTTGYFEDTTNSFTIASGDTLSYQIDKNDANNFQCYYMACDVLHETAMAHLVTYGSSTKTSDGYYPSCGDLISIASESADQVEQQAPVAGTLKNLFAIVTTNTGTSTTDIYVRDNSANSIITVQVPATTTGTFEDTTNTDAVAAGDTFNYFLDETGTTNLILKCLGMSIVNDATGSISYICAGTAANIQQGQTRYHMLGGRTGSPQSTESLAEIVLKGSGTIRKIRTYIATNTLSISTVVTVRKNAADTALTFTIGAAGTGVFEDATNSFTYADGDTICLKYVTTAGTGSAVAGSVSFEIVPDGEEISAGGGGTVIPVFMNQYRQRIA